MHLLAPAILALARTSYAWPGPTELLPRQAPNSSSTGSGTASITPHASYGSSVGVLGCKIDVNRVAYWPLPVDCDSMCVKLTYEGTSLTVLHIDTSGGNYDISYDAYSKLYCGVPGMDRTCEGGGVDMQCMLTT